MSETKNERTKLVLGGKPGKLVRFSHLHVHEARMNRQSGKLDFSVATLIPKANTEDIAAVKAAIDALKKATWTDHKKPLPPNFWNPLRDGDKDTKQDGTPLGAECKGNMVLNCKADDKNAPGVVNTTKGTDGKYLPIAKNAIKSGDWGRVSLSLFAYTKGNGGVGAGLSNVQLVREGEALSGRTAAEDDFGAFDEMEDETDNPLA